VLFGGCLIKSKNSGSLGNTADAVVEAWDGSVEKIKSTFRDIELVIPGHGAYGNAELLSHTIELVKNRKKN